MVDYGTNAIQQGDVYMFDGPNGGDIKEERRSYSSGSEPIVSSFIVMTKFIETAVYLCWFGGNEDDDGSQATAHRQWWGNEGEPKERQYRGKLQFLLDGRPVTSALLPQIEKAATDDIKNGMPKEVLASVSVSASAPSPKRVNLRADVMANTGTMYTINVGVEL
jgi:phage gp46-like protein